MKGKILKAKKRTVLMLVLILVTFFMLIGLLILILQQMLQNKVEFENINKNAKQNMEWAVVVENGNLDQDKMQLSFKDTLEKLTGTSINYSFYIADKFLNMVASDAEIDLVTSTYTESQMKRFEISDKVFSVEDIIAEYLPGFYLPEEFYRYFDINGHIYSYPHIDFSDPQIVSSFVMLAKKDLLEKYHLSPKDFSSKENTIEILKQIRKNEKVVPCLVDLISLQQMFGASIEDENGNWQDPFETEETLEALLFMNKLYRERFLSKDIFSSTHQQILEKMENGSVFLVSIDRLGESFALWKNQEKILNQYVAVGPLNPDGGKDIRFTNNFNGQFASTYFLNNSDYADIFPKIFLWFYSNNWDFTDEQTEVLRQLGLDKEIQSFEKADFTFSSDSPFCAYQELTDQGAPYQMQFSTIADSKLELMINSVNSYRSIQVSKMVMSDSPEQLYKLYQEAILYKGTLDFSLAEQWYQYKYDKVNFNN